MNRIKDIGTGIFNQTILPPFDIMINVDEHIRFLDKEIQWNEVVYLTDDNNKNRITILKNEDNVVAAMRFNFPLDDIISITQRLCNNKKILKLAVLQGIVLDISNLSSLELIQEILKKCQFQTIRTTVSEIKKFLASLSKDKVQGRGKNFSKTTIETVWRDSHGRCMFTGCGQHLGTDNLSGEQGNFSYLAHNVASSERGERGIPILSEKLSNESDNILLLCDKHHRLIDKIAGCDYPASRLSEMRVRHCRTSELLLDGLSYESVDVYILLWPVNTQVVSVPGLKEIAMSLSSMSLRSLGAPNIIETGGESLFCQHSSDVDKIVSLINISAQRILNQTRSHNFKAALFAFGPMSALIGLGALLGNKGQFLPMLRYRDGGCWMWPKPSPVNDFYSVEGFESLPIQEEVVICINFTALSPKLVEKAQELQRTKGCSIINYTAVGNFMGNGAIPHPEDGIAFCARLQQDFHNLKNEYGVKQIHLMVCASNAASIFIGQAYDLHHPDILVYDFYEEGMKPALLIQNDSVSTQISSI
ncbi:SAVED domain-containing protein [Stenoxybacter acetivorans]|uniref:SAVED domain-containing protein n=1 Tax=Stenoxybacter acetivorans TaxID=422441 RepID=UPI00055BE48E|nr:SAVED domain-containing protein [Stenoxybacter acetivorans]